jgi:hypothetical protein
MDIEKIISDMMKKYEGNEIALTVLCEVLTEIDLAKTKELGNPQFRDKIDQ